ncbi:uncharacterized protein [Littorina saxatilis]|uniref:uncharacterized protein isoform X2 n=1 Tax=Littorina saxatilis TaxID=31220 RepID=UPI0038B4C00A
METCILLILLTRRVYGQELRRSIPESLCPCATPCDATVASGRHWEDVAFRKKVEVSSRSADESIKPNKICDLTTGKQANLWQSHATDQTPWLLLDLQAEYTVNKVVLTRNNSQGDAAQRILSTTITLDGQRCYAFPDYPGVGAYSTGFWRDSYSYNLACQKPIKGRYLRIYKRYPVNDPTIQKHLKFFVLREIQVPVCKPNYYGTDVSSCKQCPSNNDCKYRCDNYYGCTRQVLHNVAVKKSATQSSVHSGRPFFAVDGILDFPHSANCTATTNQTVSWWQVDLAKVVMVYYVTVTSCQDCLGDKLRIFQAYVSKQPYSPTNIDAGQECASITKFDGFGKGLIINITCGGFLEGQFVFLVTQAPFFLEFCEVQVFAHEIEVLQLNQGCQYLTPVKRCADELSCYRQVCKAGIEGQITCPSRWYNNTPVTLRCEITKSSLSKCGYNQNQTFFFLMPKRGGDSSLCDVRNEQTSCSSQAGPIDTCWCQQNITHYIFVYHFTAIAGQHDGFWYCKKICRADNTLFSLHMKYDVECLDVGINYDVNAAKYVLSEAFLPAPPSDTTAPPSDTTGSSDEKKGKDATWDTKTLAIILGAAGGAVGLATVLALCLLWRRKRSHANNDNNPTANAITAETNASLTAVTAGEPSSKTGPVTAQPADSSAVDTSALDDMSESDVETSLASSDFTSVDFIASANAFPTFKV